MVNTGFTHMVMSFTSVSFEFTARVRGQITDFLGAARGGYMLLRECLPEGSAKGPSLAIGAQVLR
jgi:hypothetical protein